MSILLDKLVSVGDVENYALQILPKSVRDYYQSGADDERTVSRNRKAFNRLLIRPLALRDVSKIDASVRIHLRDINGNLSFDQTLPYPIAISPTALQRMAHPEGEKATAAAAKTLSTIMVNSTISTTRLEDVAAVAADSGLLWFQLYVYKDRKLTESLVRRAEASGFTALVLTVDAPVFGRRRADEKNGFDLPPHLELANFGDAKFSRLASGRTGASGLSAYTSSLFDSSLNWSDLKWLVGFTKLPVIVKGIMRGDDADSAIAHGAAAVVVSNHGGRQLDNAPATIEVLPEVVKAVRGRVPVFVDGGFRTGTDIFKGIALGADLVFVGRPAVYGLATAGSEGVQHILRLLRTEFDFALRLSGCPTIGSIRSNDQMVVHESHFAKL